MKVNTAKKMQTLAVPVARERADSCSEALSFPFLELGGCLADDGRNSRETVLAVRANAGLADIVIRAGDIIVTVWTSSVHW